MGLLNDRVAVPCASCRLSVASTMRTQAIAILLSGSLLASAFQVPLLDKIWPSMSLEQQLAQQVQQVPDELAANSTRIAIIGAGAAGSSAAFWIAKARERYGLDVEVDIYEKEGYIGGRECFSCLPALFSV